MDQVKIGQFLKSLRKGKNLTQEQAAEIFRVSRRTVTRWETDANLPDISVLIEISDFYDVDLREILNGERKSGKMDKELEETVKQVAEYSNLEKEKTSKMLLAYFAVGIISLIANQVLALLEIGETFWTGFLRGATAGLAFIALVFGILYITGILAKLSEHKKKLLKKSEKNND